MLDFILSVSAVGTPTSLYFDFACKFIISLAELKSVWLPVHYINFHIQFARVIIYNLVYFYPYWHGVIQPLQCTIQFLPNYILILSVRFV